MARASLGMGAHALRWSDSAVRLATPAEPNINPKFAHEITRFSMASVRCRKCVSQLPAGLLFCAECGAEPLAPPSDSSSALLVPTPGGRGPPARLSPTPPPTRRHGRLYWIALFIGVIVLVLVVIGAVAFYFAVSASSTVTAINTTSSDDACGMNGQTFSGFTSTGGRHQETITVTGGPLLSCTIHSVTVVTPGFGISGANVPLTVPAGGSAALTFWVHTPYGYDGVLTLAVE
jgi:hypothetical protein